MLNLSPQSPHQLSFRLRARDRNIAPMDIGATFMATCAQADWRSNLPSKKSARKYRSSSQLAFVSEGLTTRLIPEATYDSNPSPKQERPGSSILTKSRVKRRFWGLFQSSLCSALSRRF